MTYLAIPADEPLEVCPECRAVVPVSLQDRHSEWHNKVDRTAFTASGNHRRLGILAERIDEALDRLKRLEGQARVVDEIDEFLADPSIGEVRVRPGGEDVDR